MQSKQAGKPEQVDSYSTIGTKCRDRYGFPWSVAIRIPALMNQLGKFARCLLTLMALTVTMIYIFIYLQGLRIS